jgi:hypothetical protein
VLCGQFVIRYPDMPRQGPEPSGDVIKFQPDTPALAGSLPRRSGIPVDIGPRGISVRLEATAALINRFGDAHQELAGANAARDLLLAELGFTNVRYFSDLPNKVESADQDSLRGYVLSNGIDGNGRVTGFVYPGDPTAADGSDVFVDESRVDASINASLLTRGMVYPAFHGRLPVTLRNHLAAESRAARAAEPPLGIWARATGDPNDAAQILGLAQVQTMVLWPKLFRRIVPYLAAGASDFDGFEAWLREDPVHRDDELFLLDRGEPGHLHDVIHASGNTVALTVWPEDFVIEPGRVAYVIEPGSDAGGRGPVYDTRAPSAVDSSTVDDVIGREILAVHLEVLLDQLTSAQSAHTAVVHIDGQWGSGKSTLVELFLRRLSPESGENKPITRETQRLAGSVIVRYDAWRESAIAPEWWSLSTAINREVRRTRALVTRLLMSVVGVVLRWLRSPPAVLAVIVFAVFIVLLRLGVLKDAEAVGKTLVGLTGTAALALTVGRALFWSSPAFGRLHVQTEVNALDEIADIIGWLRRWSPRAAGVQSKRDTAAGGIVLTAHVVGVVAVWLLWPDPVGVVLVVAGGIIAAAVVLAHARWSALLARCGDGLSRRPVLLIVDDLDRCSAPRVVRLIETIHTLLRKPTTPVRMRRWREPAPLIVLVLADGRWVRAAFESVFDQFKGLGSPVHGLGAEFLQKVFDHTVIVPPLSETQIAAMVDVSTGRRGAPTESEKRRSEEAKQEDLDLVQQTKPGGLRGDAADRLAAAQVLLPEDQIEVEIARVAKEATPEATATREAHLMKQYVGLLPANPRLVKRTANALGMLFALHSHTTPGQPLSQDDLDARVRAAILLIRFPSLIDELLAAPTVPDITGTAPLPTGGTPSLWWRHDVQRILTPAGPGARPIGLDVIARCFGRELPVAKPGSTDERDPRD